MSEGQHQTTHLPGRGCSGAGLCEPNPGSAQSGSEVTPLYLEILGEADPVECCDGFYRQVARGPGPSVALDSRSLEEQLGLDLVLVCS